MIEWPIQLADVLDAERRIRPHLSPTPLRHYAPLDTWVGGGIRVLVKHENHQPTNAFKVRNALSVLTAMSEDERRRGVVAATRGNHGAGVAWAGERLGVPVTVCVPVGNNPEKNDAMRGFGAELIERGRDYDEAVEVARGIVADRGARLVHSTNDRDILAGAGTMTLELLDQAGDELDALVIAVGGGSQAVGALTVARDRKPKLRVYAVQAEAASAIHDGWHAGAPVSRDSADTFADGLATRNCYELTFGTLLAGLAGFVAVSEAAIADAVRALLQTTHNLAEGAGAAGLAGLTALRDQLAGATVGIVLSGGNIDIRTLQAVVDGRL